MKTSVKLKSICPILIQAGMPTDVAKSCSIEPVSEGDMAITFKITLPSGDDFFLKFSEIEGAKGGPFLKHLLPIAQVEVREHAEKRRRFVRKILDSVIAHYRPTLVPRPFYFDLSCDSMNIQKAKEKEGFFSEVRLGATSAEPLIAETVATLWKGLNLVHLCVSSPEKTNIWDVTSYTSDTLFECAAALAELQTQASLYLNAYIEYKVSKGKEPVSTIVTKIQTKLKHEQKVLLGYDFVRSDFLLALEITDAIVLEQALQFRGEKLTSSVAEQIVALGGSSIVQLQKQFLEKYPVPAEDVPQYATLPFNKLIFTAERERWWTFDARNEAKMLARLEQAGIIAESLKTKPSELGAFILWLESFKSCYFTIESLPKGIVHQDGCPVNILRNKEDGKISLIDLEDVSLDLRFADISQYIFKILRAVDSGRVVFEEALTMVQSTLDGYNSQVTTPLSKKELLYMTQYLNALFLNFLPQFGVIMRLSDSELNKFNLAMSLDDFLTLVNTYQRLCQLWSEKFLPILGVVP